MLKDASITATYNGAADGMLGLDQGFTAGPGANTSKLDPTDTGVEFFTSDFLFGIDFSADGMLTVIANYAVAPGAYSMRFDFGGALPIGPITAFTLTGVGGVREVFPSAVSSVRASKSFMGTCRLSSRPEPTLL